MIIVSGFGRCGSSLLMQMFAAGGLPCLGEYPMFEDHRTSAMGWNDSWMTEALLHHKVVKLLNPHLYKKNLPKSLPAHYIWLDRDIDEQAKSWEKMRAGMRGLPDAIKDKPFTAAMAKKMMLRHRDKALGLLKSRGAVLCLTFEQIIGNPKVISEVLEHYTGCELDRTRMVQAVIPRGPACLPDLLEADQMREREPSE